MCLLGLPGCSGCQKKTVETPPKPEEVTSPPAEPAPEKRPEPQSEPQSETDTESEPKVDLAEKSQVTESDKTPSASASPTGAPASPAGGSKSGNPESNGPQVGAVPRPPGGSKGRSPASEPGSPKPGRPPRTPAAALETARGLHAKSVKAAELSQYGKAYDLSSQAWEALHAFPQDSECQALCKQLETELELLGDRANALVAPEDANRKRLVDQ